MTYGSPYKVYFKGDITLVKLNPQHNAISVKYIRIGTAIYNYCNNNKRRHLVTELNNTLPLSGNTSAARRISIETYNFILIYFTTVIDNVLAAS